MSNRLLFCKLAGLCKFAQTGENGLRAGMFKFFIPFSNSGNWYKKCAGLKLLTECNSFRLCQLAQMGESGLKRG